MMRQRPRRQQQHQPLRDLVVYFHVPRTGGTSFLQYAEKAVSKDRILAIYSDLIPRARDVIGGVRDWGQWRLARGHITTSCLDLLPSHAVLMTFLRNPVERVNSLYKYIRKDPNHPVYQEVGQMSLVEFICSEVSLEVDNGMVRQLCGTEPALLQCAYDPGVHSTGQQSHTPPGELGRSKLVEAMEVLDQFHVVGTTELMNETYKVLWELVDWKHMAIPRANRTSPTVLTPTERSTVEEHNQLDLELWRWGTARLRGGLL